MIAAWVWSGSKLGGTRAGKRFPAPLLVLSALLGSCSGSDGPSGPSSPGTLVVLEGAEATAPAGTVVPVGPTLQLLDARGTPVEGAPVLLEVVEGGGRVVTASIQTDAQGRAMGIWILGREAGLPQRLRATSGSLTVEVSAHAMVGVPGETYLGRESYVEYRPGSLPLILTAPHGGYLEPAEISDRTWGTTGQDRNTRELTLAIREALHARTGAYPYLVILNLHRRKLDGNREIVEGAQGDHLAERAWWEFQMFAQEAGERVEETRGGGLHLDIHGHGHAIPRLELGYMLSRADLAQPDGVLDGQAYVNKSSVRGLVETSGGTLAQLVRGPFSLGTLLENRTVPAVPSTSQPNPGEDEYFTGGYNTDRHGSAGGGTISAVQIEHHFPGLRDTQENREQYAERLADALMVYFLEHFGLDLAALNAPALPPLPGAATVAVPAVVPAVAAAGR